MQRILRIVHFLALATFLGSIFGHIVLARMAVADPAAALPLLQGKLAMVHALTLPGLGLLALTGAGLALLTRAPGRTRRWLIAKLCLVLAVGANGVLVLTPISAQQVELARATLGTLPPEFHALALREHIAGGLNLLAVAAIIALAVFRPGFRSARRLGEVRP